MTTSVENRLSWNLNSTYKNFKVQKVVPLGEIHANLIELEHIPSGAIIVHLATDDPENVFSLSFRTYPEKSDGVAHILEHTVLCGSKNFPVKDPFFSMTRRSVNTFMNAMTGHDFTCYPAASQEKKDFYNLLEVYLDAVFYPNLKEYSFLQEGHRFDLEGKGTEEEALCYKGIVFNEMKGAMSAPESRLWQDIVERLYPGSTYAVNSGGDPKVIPELTYEELLNFHQTYYTPSRCIFYFYGSFPLEEHLDFLEEKVLSAAEKMEPVALIPSQKRLEAPVAASTTYPVAEVTEEEQGIVGLSWLTCDILAQDDVLALLLLDIILMGTDAALLKKTLLQSGLCKQVQASLDEEMRDIPYLLIFRGCDPDKGAAIEQVVLERLQEIIKEGIPQHLVEGAIHQLEFDRLEISGGGYPYGLQLFFRSILLQQHGGLGEEGLQVHKLFQKLRERCEDPSYLLEVIQTQLLDNSHRVRIDMHPDPECGQKENEEEATVLSSIYKTLSDQDKEKIAQQAEQLRLFQEDQEGENLEVLPKIVLDEVSKEGKDFPLKMVRKGGFDVYWHECFTNEITYADLLLPLPKLSKEQLLHLPLFTTLLPQLGSGGRSYQENLEYMLRYTGGIAAQPRLMQRVEQGNYLPLLGISGKALERHSKEFFALLYDTLYTADFTDEKRLRELLLKHYAGLQHSLIPHAMNYAIMQSSSGLSESHALRNQWHGLPYYQMIKAIVDDIDNAIPVLIETLLSLQEVVKNIVAPHLVLSCSEDAYQQLEQQSFYLTKPHQGQQQEEWSVDSLPAAESDQGHLVAAPVAFTAKVLPTVPYTHEDAPCLSIAARLFTNLVLHRKIREQGGAYGGGARHNSLGETFTYYAYRDPNLAQTLAAFDAAVSEIQQGNFTEQELEEAKLGVVQALDAPVSPRARAMQGYSWMQEERSLAVRNAFRERLFAATKSDVCAAITTHIAAKQSQSKLVALCGQELLDQEQEALNKLGVQLEIHKV